MYEDKRIKNLIPLNKRTEEERKRIASKGGKASAESKKNKKKLSEFLDIAINSKIKNVNLKKSLEAFDFEEEDLNYNSTVVAGIIKAASQGDMKAVQIIREMTDDKPYKDIEKQKIKIPAELIGKSFTELNHYVSIRKYREYWLKGGRGSTKSSYVGLKVIEEIENNLKFCATIFRKVQNTLKKSIFEQVTWAIVELDKYYPGLRDDYKITSSNLEITKISTGQKIYFVGLDDEEKSKSLKAPNDMYFAIQVWEEFDQIDGMQVVRTVDQTTLRGGKTYIKFYMYNTPKSNKHWVNQEALVIKKNKYVHLSNCYQIKYTGWNGEPFYEEAEFLRTKSDKLWRNEYLGEATGLGGQVFDNLEIRKITKEERETFDFSFQGTDWGWFPDPMSWGRYYYDTSNQTLYIYDEIHGCKIENKELAKQIIEKGVGAEENICDNAEPKSIQELVDFGTNATKTIKKIAGANLLDYGMKWLQTRIKIVIDIEDCPYTAKEFTEYELEMDKQGNYISRYPDKDNHTIDRTRYACLRYILSNLESA